MARTKLVLFKVEGIGTFPVDMLRYDRCFPASSQDASAILGREHRTVELIGEHITTARWMSFMWKVISSRATDNVQ